MSELSGALTDFPLRQVLRLISSGEKSGILVVTGESIRGSIFFRDGRVIFATTRSGPSPVHEPGADRRRPNDADVDRILTSVAMRLLRLEDGTFVFQSGVEPMHPATGDLEVAELIERAEQLIGQWLEIEKAIGSMVQPFALRLSNDTENITLTPMQWNVLAAIGTASTAAEVASRAAMPEFDVASTMADLIEAKLITAVQRDEPIEVPAPPAPTEDIEPPTREPEALPKPVPERQHVAIAEPGAEIAAEPTLAERYEYYVNSRGAELREPPPEAGGIVLDLTDGAERALAPASGEPDVESEPASELARRWRDLRRGLPVEDE